MCNDNATVIIETNEVLSNIIVENECSEFTIIVSGLGQQGVPGIINLVTNGFGEDIEYNATTQTLTIDKYNWMDLARGYNVIPTLHNTTATGKIFKYIYTASTFYRYIATDLSIDAFYTTDSLSVELCRKKIIL
jgi:hypothetical protein